MSKYAALRREYAFPTPRKLGDTPRLRRAAQGLLDNLTLFLDLPIRCFTDLDGLEMPYLSLGRIENGQFRLGKIEDFVAWYDGLNFTINIVLDKAADQFPKAYICFNFTVDEQDGALTVISHSAPGGPFIINESDFTPVSEHIYNVIRTELASFHWPSV